MIQEEADRLRLERKAKMREIKENISNGLWKEREGVTSAPNVTEVDEFHEELSAAEKRKRTAEKILQQQNSGPKAKLKLTTRTKNDKNQDEEFSREELDILESSLVMEAMKRHRKSGNPGEMIEDQIDADIADIFSDDAEIQDIKHSGSQSLMIISESAKKSDHTKRKSNSFRGVRSSTGSRNLSDISETTIVNEFEEPKSKAERLEQSKNQIKVTNAKNQSTMMTLENAKTLQKEEVRPSSHTTTLYDNGKYQSLSYQNDYSIGSNKKSKSTTLESGSDPLSQSLPAKNLKKMKKSESVENSSVKCVYDSRLFKMDEADDTEYLKAKRQDNNSFKDFLNASFNNERKTSKVDPKDDDTSIDCIDLENDHEYESVTTFRSASPTISIRTEFTDPDLYGKSKQKGIQNDNNGAIIGTIQSMVGSVIGSGAGQTNQTRRPKSTYPRIEENEEDAKGSKKGNKMSCWAFIFLLAVDAFTIGLVIFLFSHHHFEGNIDASGGHGHRTERQIGLPDSISKSPESQILNRSLNVETKNGPTVPLSSRTISETPASKTSTYSTTSSSSTTSTSTTTTTTSASVSSTSATSSSTPTPPEMKIQNGNVAFPDTRKRDQRDIIIRKSVEVHDSPDNELSTDGLPKFSSTPSSTAPIETTTGFSVSSEMFYNLQEELRTVRNQHLTHGIAQEDWKIEIENLKKEIALLKRPPAFACHKTKSHTSQGIITFSGCNVPTPGMDPSTGIFTVKEPGIYHLSFTGLFHSLNGHGLNADIIKRTGRSETNLGRSRADSNEIATFFTKGTDDDIYTTTTVITMHKLNVNDKIFIRMEVDGNHGNSNLFSDGKPTIHFVGQMISSL